MLDNSRLNLINFISESVSSDNSTSLELLRNTALNNSNKMIIKDLNKISTKYIIDQMDIWKNQLAYVPEVLDWYKHMVNNIPSTQITLQDEKEIIKISPEYLLDYTENVQYIIDDVMKGNKSNEVNKLLTDSTLVSVKKKIAITTKNFYRYDKEILKFDNSQEITISTGYIHNTIINYLISCEKNYENMSNQVYFIIETVNDCSKRLTTYVKTINRIIDEGKCVNPNLLYAVGIKSLMTFNKLAKYVIALELRKIGAVTHNLNQFFKIKSNFELSHNVIESTFTESYDGSDNYIYMITELSDKLSDYYSKYKKNWKLSVNLDKELEYVPYKTRILSAYNEIFESVRTLIKESGDVDASLDDILHSTFGNKNDYEWETNGPVINTDISQYVNSDLLPSNKSKIYLSELYFTIELLSLISSISKQIFNLLEDFNIGLSENRYPYTDFIRNEMEIPVLTEIKYKLYFLIQSTVNGIDTRIENILAYLTGNSYTDVLVIDDEPITFLEDAVIANIEIEEFYNESVSEDIFNAVQSEKNYSSTKVDDIMFFENENGGQNNNQGTDNNNNQGSNQGNNNGSGNNNQGNGNNQNSDNTKPTVTDNSGQNNNQGTDNNNNQGSNQGNNNGSGNNSNSGETVNGIIERIKDFFNKLFGKVEKSVQKVLTNEEWVEHHKDSILKKDYGNITIQVLPYAKNIQYTKVLNDIAALFTSSDMRPDRLMKWDERTIESKMFKGINLRWDPNVKLETRLASAIKGGGKAKLENVTYRGSGARSEVESMISYLEYYYKSYLNEYTNAHNAILSALDKYEKMAKDIYAKSSHDNTNTSEIDKKILMMSTKINVLAGTISTVARDRQNDYIIILKNLVNGSSTPANNTDNNNNDNSGSSQPTDNNSNEEKK